MNKLQLADIKNKGFGIGFRKPHFQQILTKAPSQIDWFEVISENYMGIGGIVRKNLERLRENYQIATHGVGLSIAECDEFDLDYLKKLKNYISWLEPMVVTDHLCWTGLNKKVTHDLLPLPLNQDSLDYIVNRVDYVQNYLGRQILLENPSCYVGFTDSYLKENDFFNQLCRRTGAGMLLDVNNIYVNHKNLDTEFYDYVDGLDGNIVHQIHIAGHTVTPEVIIDTHSALVCPEVWDLYKYTVKKFKDASTLLEWDDDIPKLDVMCAELQKAKDHYIEVNSTLNICKPQKTFVESGLVEQKIKIPQSLLMFQNSFLSSLYVDESLNKYEGIKNLDFAMPVQAKAGIAVYHNAYFLQALEVLKGNFPILYFILEDDFFTTLVSLYLQNTDSTSYNIELIGSKLATFLIEYEFSREFDPGVEFEVLANIAIFENARSEVLLSAEDNIATADLSHVKADEWSLLQTKFKSSMRIISLDYDVLKVAQVFAKGDIPNPPELKKQYILMNRVNNVDFSINEVEITQEVYDIVDFFNRGNRFADSKWVQSNNEKSIGRVVNVLAQLVQSELITELVLK